MNICEDVLKQKYLFMFVANKTVILCVNCDHQSMIDQSQSVITFVTKTCKTKHCLV